VLELAIREITKDQIHAYGKACSNHANLLNTKQELVQYGTPVMPETRI